MEQFGIGRQLGGGAGGDEVTVAEHVGPVGDLEREVHVLLDEQHAGAGVVRDLRASPAAAARR